MAEELGWGRLMAAVCLVQGVGKLGADESQSRDSMGLVAWGERTGHAHAHFPLQRSGPVCSGALILLVRRTIPSPQ